MAYRTRSPLEPDRMIASSFLQTCRAYLFGDQQRGHDMSRLISEARARGLELPFPEPPGCVGVISVGYRNEWGSRSAVVLIASGYAACCEHGAVIACNSPMQAFARMRRPAFCDECIAVAVREGHTPQA